VSDALMIINESGLLTTDDSARLMALSNEVQQTFATAQVFRTTTEMQVSVLNDMKRPTADSKYWQAVREQDVFVQELVHLSYEYRKVLLELRRLRRKLETEEDDIEREALELEIEHQSFVAMIMARQAHHRVREIAAWSEIKDQLVPHLKYGTEDVNAHQLEAMRIRWTMEAQLVNEHTPVADARNILGLAQATQKGLE